MFRLNVQFMTWIDERLAERERLKIRNALVEHGSVPIFNDLWAEVLRLVEEAKDKGVPVGTNGLPSERIVWQPGIHPPNDSDERRRELRIKLLEDRESISVSGPHVSLQFSIDLCDDNVVCLKHDGQPLVLSDV